MFIEKGLVMDVIRMENKAVVEYNKRMRKEKEAQVRFHLRQILKKKGGEKK